mgnify:CR=1 FL=1
MQLVNPKLPMLTQLPIGIIGYTYTWKIQTALHTAIHTAGLEISAGNSQ